ncbi:hypothetical protein [Lentzea sp. CC55]|uniref:hypothetical protein n=1 Tax=Lentzea sp. CC55 TaxID=2884909 RepID=UPI001F3DCE5C|nr:hypothetical protein [Lentzea sp. CC55]MCG8924851.1 hypothetical protein [Lentzea sp. CC55]
MSDEEQGAERAELVLPSLPEQDAPPGDASVQTPQERTPAAEGEATGEPMSSAQATVPPENDPPSPRNSTSGRGQTSGLWVDDRDHEYLRHEGGRPYSYDDRRTVVENLIADGNTVVGSGSSQFNSTQNNFYGRKKGPTARSGRFHRSVTITNSQTYVPFPCFPQAAQTLRDRGVVYLCGPADSGRLSTAIELSTGACGPSRVVMIDVDDDFDVATLIDEETKSVLRTDHAHVLEIGAGKPVRRSTLDSLAGWAMDHNAAIVVIGPAAEQADDRLQPYAVPHQPPEPVAVLVSHLQHGLSFRNGPAGFVDQCLTDEKIMEYLERSQPPRQVADLAARLLDGIDTGREPGEALSRTSAYFRFVAQDLLQVIESSRSIGETRARHREVAARLAYAVFQDYTMTDVADTAILLFGALQTCHRTTRLQTTAPVFGKGVEAFLDKRMSILDRPVDGEERRARLVDPSLAQHLLDVAWNDFDAVTRAPLIGWLDELVTDGRKWIVLRAALTAGYLATHDFSVLYQRLIKPWATAPAFRRRQAAAWALEAASLNRRLTSRVTRQVADWAWSPNHLMNDTAALAYATRIGRLSVENSLAGLRAVAVHPRLMTSPTVSNAIAQLYAPDQAHLVLKELTTWADAGAQTKVHASRSIVFLSLVNEPDGVWPVLLRLIAEDEQAREQVTALWRAAVTEPLVGKRAWETLLQLVLRGDHEVDLGSEVESFLLALLRQPDLVRRARFNVHVWRSEHPDAALLKRIDEKL